jgi:hypothetical protein
MTETDNVNAAIKIEMKRPMGNIRVKEGAEIVS